MANQASRESSHCYAKWGAHAAAQKSLRSTSPLGDLPAASCKSRPSESTFSTSEIVTRYDVLVGGGVFMSDHLPECCNSALDLDTVVQATQNLSSKLKLNDLLASLMNLIVVNTGASKVGFSFVFSLFFFLFLTRHVMAAQGVLLLTDSDREEVPTASDRSQDTGESSLETSDSNEGGDASQLFIRAKAKSSLVRPHNAESG